jgi:hypothetical protein
MTANETQPPGTGRPPTPDLRHHLQEEAKKTGVTDRRRRRRRIQIGNDP